MGNLYAGRRAPGKPQGIVCEHDVVYPVFELPGHVSMPEDATVNRSLAMALRAAREALQQAGLTSEVLADKRVGVCVGTSTGASLNMLDYYAAYKAGMPADAAEVALWRHSNPGLGLARVLGFDGPVQTVVNACSSGGDAIGIGMSWIQNGLCDIVLAGGCDELSSVPYNGFIRLMIYDSEPCRPFDARRKGLNLGEGAGMLVLESRSHADRRGAEMLAVAAGFGCAADAHHLTAPHPEGSSLRKAITEALQRAGIDIGRLGFINAHGTATPNNDRAESLVLAEMFPDTPVVATKGYTGHTLGAAGAIEAVFTVMALRDGKLPASIGCEQPDPDLQITPVQALTFLQADYGMSQSLGFGGNNAVLVFGRGDVS
jgi:3-oxoacyl-[acyl-carrier-protein] synthase-1/3-oxoacyl-[acyl-carrier-protein] synthase II